jgi:predicted MFS family arabinose efflux permease
VTLFGFLGRVLLSIAFGTMISVAAIFIPQGLAAPSGFDPRILSLVLLGFFFGMVLTVPIGLLATLFFAAINQDARFNHWALAIPLGSAVGALASGLVVGTAGVSFGAGAGAATGLFLWLTGATQFHIRKRASA